MACIGSGKQKRMRNKRGWLACVACLLVFAGIALWRQCDAPAASSYRHNEGLVFNTIYHFTYQSDEDYQSQIEEELSRFDASLSPFNPIPKARSTLPFHLSSMRGASASRAVSP